MDAAVILVTYQWPEALELVLWGWASQTRRVPVVIADDGSGPDTRALIERMRGETGLDLVHVWHPDQGFRKSEILNRAIVAANHEYLIFSDGDVIPRDDLVATHLAHAAPGRYLTGMTVRLTPEVSEAITPDDVRAGRATDLGWLRTRGLRPGRHALRFSRSRAFNTVMDRITTTPARWRGGNSSAWREDLVRANGYEMAMGYGGQDAELGDRLDNLGLRPARLRFRTCTVHLHHERPWRDPEIMQRNREWRLRVRREGITRARSGIAELDPA